MYPPLTDGCSNGNQVAWVRDKALQYCKGKGVDIGCEGHKLSPETIGVDIVKHPGVDVISTPEKMWDHFEFDELDYVFSSHCLEHIGAWESAINIWVSLLKKGGILFLYLPFAEIAPGWSKKIMPQHKHDFTPEQILSWIIGATTIRLLEFKVDEYGSFYIVGFKE